MALEKHKVNAKRSWRKAHFAVDEEHFIQSAVLTDKNTMNDQVVGAICQFIITDVEHVSADKMYDANAVYQTLEDHFPDAELVIPPKDNTFADEAHHPKRMSNLIGCFALGIIGWQSVRQYGKRNISETAMQRYKMIIGNTLHSRDIENQSKEMLLGCSILNRFTHLGASLRWLHTKLTASDLEPLGLQASTLPKAILILTGWVRCLIELVLVHCRSEAEEMLAVLKERFESCGLELHSDKTKIVYCKDGGRKGNNPKGARCKPIFSHHYLV